MFAKKKWSRIVLAMLCLGMAVLSFLEVLDPVIEKAGAGDLQQRNEVYLEDTFQKALIGFGVMSGLKAGLAVVEGSTGGVSAGISVNLQIGDVVQSAYDFVDIAWRTLLLGCISLLSIQYLLEAVSLIDAAVLGIYFLLIALCMFWQRPPQAIRDARRFLLFGVLILYILFPLAVFSGSMLSKHITRPSITSAQAGFSQTREKMFPENEALPEGMLARVKQIPERLEQIANYLQEQSAEMALWTIQLIAGYLFDCFLFPLGSFLILLWGTRSLMRYCTQCSFQDGLYRELAKLRIDRSAS